MPKLQDGREVLLVREKRAPTAWNKAVKAELDKGKPLAQAVADAKKHYTPVGPKKKRASAVKKRAPKKVR